MKHVWVLRRSPSQSAARASALARAAMERSRLLSPDDSRRDVVGFLARLAPLGLTLSVALAVVALTAAPPGSVADAAASPVQEGGCAVAPAPRAFLACHHKTGTVAALAVTSKIAALGLWRTSDDGNDPIWAPVDEGDRTNALPCDEDEARDRAAAPGGSSHPTRSTSSFPAAASSSCDPSASTPLVRVFGHWGRGFPASAATTDDGAYADFLARPGDPDRLARVTYAEVDVRAATSMLRRCDGSYRVVHFVRDPVEIALSSARYTRRGDEAWQRAPANPSAALTRVLLASSETPETSDEVRGFQRSPPPDDASPDPRALARRLVASLPARGTREAAAEAAREKKAAEEKADGDGDEPFVSLRSPTQLVRSLPPGAAAVAHLELELLGFGAGVPGFGLANIVNAYKLARSDPERHAVVRLEDVQKGGAAFDAAWRDAIAFVTPGLGPDASASALEAARTEDLTRHADAKGAAHATTGPGGIGESAEDAREARCALLTHEAFGPMLRWFRTASGYPETTDADDDARCGEWAEERARRRPGPGGGGGGEGVEGGRGGVKGGT